MTRNRQMWHTWPGRGFPADPIEECRLVADLTASAATEAAPKRGWERDDLTMVLTMLRCGATFADAARFAPGLSATNLLDAYRHLEAALDRSRTAWLSVLVRPTCDELRSHADLASALLPACVGRMLVVCRNSPAHLPEAAAALDREVRSVQAAADEALLRIQRLGPEHPRAKDVVDELFHPVVPGWWGHELFLPRRVGECSPVRVRDLLEEDRA